eukprot:TRINITY_DN12943_c0_g1_i1.p1 TRINITY_DN12943_c0_g1~~TRINITY_DN12943_c0_g1_i1.p1  ORF type:complete len:1371 (-),score=317.54 TRINITY_DN12943_c0_g1_i1:101-4159(-)
MAAQAADEAAVKDKQSAAPLEDNATQDTGKEGASLGEVAVDRAPGGTTSVALDASVAPSAGAGTTAAVDSVAPAPPGLPGVVKKEISDATAPAVGPAPQPQPSPANATSTDPTAPVPQQKPTIVKRELGTTVAPVAVAPTAVAGAAPANSKAAATTAAPKPVIVKRELGPSTTQPAVAGSAGEAATGSSAGAATTPSQSMPAAAAGVKEEPGNDNTGPQPTQQLQQSATGDVKDSATTGTSSAGGATAAVAAPRPVIVKREVGAAAGSVSNTPAAAVAGSGSVGSTPSTASNATAATTPAGTPAARGPIVKAERREEPSTVVAAGVAATSQTSTSAVAAGSTGPAAPGAAAVVKREVAPSGGAGAAATSQTSTSAVAAGSTGPAARGATAVVKREVAPSGGAVAPAAAPAAPKIPSAPKDAEDDSDEDMPLTSLQPATSRPPPPPAAGAATAAVPATISAPSAAVAIPPQSASAHVAAGAAPPVAPAASAAGVTAPPPLVGEGKRPAPPSGDSVAGTAGAPPRKRQNTPGGVADTAGCVANAAVVMASEAAGCAASVPPSEVPAAEKAAMLPDGLSSQGQVTSNSVALSPGELARRFGKRKAGSRVPRSPAELARRVGKRKAAAAAKAIGPCLRCGGNVGAQGGSGSAAKVSVFCGSCSEEQRRTRGLRFRAGDFVWCRCRTSGRVDKGGGEGKDGGAFVSLPAAVLRVVFRSENEATPYVVRIFRGGRRSIRSEVAATVGEEDLTSWQEGPPPRPPAPPSSGGRSGSRIVVEDLVKAIALAEAAGASPLRRGKVDSGIAGGPATMPSEAGKRTRSPQAANGMPPPAGKRTRRGASAREAPSQTPPVSKRRRQASNKSEGKARSRAATLREMRELLTEILGREKELLEKLAQLRGGTAVIKETSANEAAPANPAALDDANSTTAAVPDAGSEAGVLASRVANGVEGDAVVSGGGGSEPSGIVPSVLSGSVGGSSGAMIDEVVNDGRGEGAATVSVNCGEAVPDTSTVVSTPAEVNVTAPRCDGASDEGAVVAEIVSSEPRNTIATAVSGGSFVNDSTVVEATVNTNGGSVGRLVEPRVCDSVGLAIVAEQASVGESRVVGSSESASGCANNCATDDVAFATAASNVRCDVAASRTPTGGSSADDAVAGATFSCAEDVPPPEPTPTGIAANDAATVAAAVDGNGGDATTSSVSTTATANSDGDVGASSPSVGAVTKESPSEGEVLGGDCTLAVAPAVLSGDVSSGSVAPASMAATGITESASPQGAGGDEVAPIAPNGRTVGEDSATDPVPTEGSADNAVVAELDASGDGSIATTSVAAADVGTDAIATATGDAETESTANAAAIPPQCVETA